MPITEFVVEIPPGTSKDVGFNERKRSIRVGIGTIIKCHCRKRRVVKSLNRRGSRARHYAIPDGLFQRNQDNRLLHLRVTENRTSGTSRPVARPEAGRSNKTLAAKMGLISWLPPKLRRVLTVTLTRLRSSDHLCPLGVFHPEPLSCTRGRERRQLRRTTYDCGSAGAARLSAGSAQPGLSPAFASLIWARRTPIARIVSPAANRATARSRKSSE